MIARQGGHILIAIGGRRLDEVRIRQNRTDMVGTLSFLSRPSSPDFGRAR
ncbi:MAG: hypothetical protein ACYDEY_16715 [Acidimicrobiales bacterium]